MDYYSFQVQGNDNWCLMNLDTRSAQVGGHGRIRGA